MNKKITFLGIETSCDETAAAVIRENEKSTADILSNVVSSQIEEHKEFGGVVPEVASREHELNIIYVVKNAFSHDAECKFISNPIKHWVDGKLYAQAINFRL